MSPGADDRVTGPIGGSTAGHLFGSSDRADSAGVPWQGRSFAHTAASDDDGSADQALLAALTDFASGAGDPAIVVDAVRGARLLVPLLARAGDVRVTSDGRTVDKTQELSLATVRAPDGRSVLPAFSSVRTMAAWNPRARPVPAAGPRIALAAAGEQTELIVIDPTSPTEFVLRRPAIKALATDEPWAPPWSDGEVAAAFRRALGTEESAIGLTLENGDPTARLRGAEVEVVLRLRPGLDQDALRDLVQRLSTTWGASAVIAERVDSMALRLLQG